MSKNKKSSFRGKVRQSANNEETKNSFSYLKLPKGVPTYSPIPGKTEKIDILPYEVLVSNHPDKDTELGIAEKGSLWYKRPFKVHSDVGANKDKVVCLSSFGKKCPICEYRAKRAKEGADKDELTAYNAKQRVLYIVIPRGNSKFEEVPHIFDMSQFLFQTYLNEELNENDDFEVFPDLEEGYTLKIRWSEESFAGHKYAEVGRIDFETRKKAIKEDVLEDFPELDSLLKEISYEAMEKLFLEMDVEVEDEGEEKPKQRSKKSVEKVKELVWDDLKDAEADELSEIIDARQLDIDVNDYDNALEIATAIAEELEIEVVKAPAKRQRPSKEKEPEAGVTLEALMEMKMKELKEVIKENKLGIDTDDYDTNTQVAEVIAEALNLVKSSAAKTPKDKETTKELKWADLTNMGMKDLKGVIKDKGLEIETDDYNNVSEVAVAIADELGIKPTNNVNPEVKKKPDTSKKPAETSKAAKTADEACPHGFKFGVDTDKHKPCADCENWTACIDKKEGN